MRLSIFSKFTPLRLLLVADTRFASIIVMLKRMKHIKTGLQAMVISEEWSSYREGDIVKANFVKEKIMNDECDAWLLEDSTRSAPHRDAEISQERMKYFRRLFPNDDEHSIVLDEHAMFSMKSGFFSDLTSISMMDSGIALVVENVPRMAINDKCPFVKNPTDKAKISAFPDDLSLGMSFPGDLSPRNSRWGTLVRDSFSSDNPQRKGGSYIFSSQEISATVAHIPRRHVAGETPNLN
nr:hAT dimerization domain, ribonuclease H-like domain protein [Tanacetum cinerariifolium]